MRLTRSSAVPTGQTHPQKERPKIKDNASKSNGAPITTPVQWLATPLLPAERIHGSSQEVNVGTGRNVSRS